MGELRVEHVPCFLHTEIQGEKIPEVPEGMPFTTEFLDRLLANCPVVVEIIHDETENTRPLYGTADNTSIGLHRISNNHGRSYELSLGLENYSSRPFAVWADEHDNVYSSLSLKGNNFSRPFIQKSLTAPSGYIPHGFQETDSFLRVIRSSNMMTAANIGTEKIIRVVEPQRFRLPAFDSETDAIIKDKYEYVPLAEAKRRLLLMDWQKIADQPNALDEFTKVRQAIDNMSFFVTLRAMSTGNRIMDLCGPKDRFLPQVEQLFRVLETVTEHEEGKGPLNAENKEHLEWFFSFYLPTTIGTNMAKLHKLGLMHTFPTMGNINALGDLIDLDSVKGAPLGLGDEELTDDDYFSDVMFFLHDPNNREELDQLARNFVETMGEEYNPEPENCNDNLPEEKDNLLKAKVFTGDFNARFVSAYIHERFNMGDEYEMTEEDLCNFLDFIDMDIQKGDGYGYDNYLKLILKTALKDCDYESLVHDNELVALTHTFARWGVDYAADRLLRIVTSKMDIVGSSQYDNDAELELDLFHGSMDQIHQEERLFRHNLATEFMESEEFISRMHDWLDAQLIPEAPFKKETVIRAAVIGLRERISRSIYNMSLVVDKHPGQTLHFFVEQAAEGLFQRSDYDAEVHGLLVDNTVCFVWTGVPKNVLAESLKSREGITLEKHTAKPLVDTIEIPSSDGVRLQQIFHDGQLITDFHIQQHGAFGEGGTLAFKPHPDSTYIAFTLFNEAENTLHMYTYQKKSL